MCVCTLSHTACKVHAQYYIVICGLSGSGVLYIISQTARFSEKKLSNIKYVFWFSLQLLSETVLILRWTEWDTITNVHTSSCKVHVILSWFEWKLSFLNRFSENINKQILMKIGPGEAKIIHANRQTDRHDKAKSCLFANIPKNFLLQREMYSSTLIPEGYTKF